MIFQPVLALLALLAIFVPLIFVTIAATAGKFPFARGKQKPQKPTPHRTLWALRTVMVLACFVMLLRPGLPGGTTNTLATNTDVLLVVDTTASIVAEDWDDASPRLDGVRADVAAIAAEYPGARFSLLTFDAAAQVRLPLTTDTTALASVMSILTPEVTTQSRGSSIGIAANLVQETLARAAENSPDRARMVFYFGDGEQTASTPPESFDASAEFTDGGMVLGYGTTQGGAMKLTSGRLGTDNSYIEYQGQKALSTIDEAALEQIAGELGVSYQHRAADKALSLPEAPSTTTTQSAGTTGSVIELYWIAAALVMALLAVEACLAVRAVLRLRGLAAPGGTS